MLLPLGSQRNFQLLYLMIWPLGSQAPAELPERELKAQLAMYEHSHHSFSFLFFADCSCRVTPNAYFSRLHFDIYLVTSRNFEKQVLTILFKSSMTFCCCIKSTIKFLEKYLLYSGFIKVPLFLIYIQNIYTPSI